MYIAQLIFIKLLYFCLINCNTCNWTDNVNLLIVIYL